VLQRRSGELKAKISGPAQLAPLLELASHIAETKSGRFEPEKFEDHYEDALKELLRKSSLVRRSSPLESVRQPKSSI
jgi:DNA end-binding protein Ku